MASTHTRKHTHTHTHGRSPVLACQEAIDLHWAPLPVFLPKKSQEGNFKLTTTSIRCLVTILLLLFSVSSSLLLTRGISSPAPPFSPVQSCAAVPEIWFISEDIWRNLMPFIITFTCGNSTHKLALCNVSGIPDTRWHCRHWEASSVLCPAVGTPALSEVGTLGGRRVFSGCRNEYPFS